MKASQKAIDLIKRFEGCRLKAYRCPKGILTIGYGSTGRHVHEGMVITQEQAEDLLRDDLVRFEEGVERFMGLSEINQNEFDACVSLSFNIGLEAFRTSSVLRYHLLGDKAKAAGAFGLWRNCNGQVLPGLVNRRLAESNLYLENCA